MIFILRRPVSGEILIAWQSYTACSSDEINLKEGDVVELVDPNDSATPIKRQKLTEDADLDAVSSELLDNSAAKHKLSVKPKRTHSSSRTSPSRLNLNKRWLVREVSGKKQGWVPCRILQAADDPTPGGSILPGDAIYRRQAVVNELVETEQEFVKDLEFVVQKYLILSEKGKVPKVVRDNFEVIFGNLKEIAEFHKTVLMEGVKYYASEPHLLGKAFLRLERDFDKHVDYCVFEPQAQVFLDHCDAARDYFDELSQRLGDNKSISEHLKLPIQRINDYQLLLKELVRYSACLGEEHGDLQKALELMLSVPHRAQDDKFINSIEGYRGTIHKLGRLLAHDWFSVTFSDVIKERYLFLFKGRILICKVRRISEDRSVFQLKDIIYLNRVILKDHTNEDRVFELIDSKEGHSLILTSHRDNTKDYWLEEISEFAKNYDEQDEVDTEDFAIASPVESTSTSNKQLESNTAVPTSRLEDRASKKELLKQTEAEKQIEAQEQLIKVLLTPSKSAAEPKTKEVPKVDESKATHQKSAVSKTVEAAKATETGKVQLPKSVETPKPSATAKAVEAQKPPATSKPAEAAKPPEKPKRAESPKPIEAPKPVVTPKPTETPKPAANSVPVIASKPTETPKLAAASKPTEASKPAENPKPVEARKPTETSKPVEAPKPPVSPKSIETVPKPTEPPKPAENPKPVEARKPTETSKPVDAPKPPVTPKSIETVPKPTEPPKPTVAVAPKPAEASKPTETPKPVVETPKPVEAPKPTETPKPAGVPKPAVTPKSTGSPKPVESPKLAGAPKPAEAPKPTESPKSTEKAEPKPSETPKVTGNPKPAESPKSAEAPKSNHEELESSTSTAPKAKDNPGKSKTKAKAEPKVEEVKKEEEFQPHLAPIQAVETLVHLNKKRELETPIPYVHEPFVEPHGSALNKLYSVEPVAVGNPQVVTDYSIGIEVNVEVDDMSKRYSSSSSARAESTSIQNTTKTTTLVDSTGTTQTAVESSAAYCSTTEVLVKETAGKSAVVKLAELESEDGTHARFIKTIRGANIELSTDELVERTENDKPEFLVNLKDTELPVDTYLRFMIKIRGDPNPDITFFKDGVKISENAERLQIIREHSDKGFYELLIPEVKMDDAGSYKCVATNRFGESSSEATLTVIDNTKIHEEMPEGEILPPGEKPEFTWKKDGAFFEPEERFKVLMGDDEDSLALVFQHVRPEDVGLYTCVAQTSRGHISCSAELTVHGTVNQLFREPEKPQLIIEKKDPIVTQGGSAMLELQVKGYPKPNVKWQHEGKTIEASAKYKILYEDEESMSLVIKNVESADAGKYTIIAENDLGSETAEMTLTVKAPPKVKAKIEDVDAHADLLLKIPVEIEGIPKPTVMFYKDGKEIKQDQRIKVVEEGEKHILVIEKTQLKDSGTYSVVATNELAQVSQFWKTDIHSKPKIIEKLGQDRQISQGQNLELKVKIEAEPRAEVKWFKDESEITSSDHFVVKEDGDSYILRITGAVTTDAAKYKFKAVNIHGSVEDEVRVDVKKGPKITKPLQNMTVTEHDKDVTFDVRIEAFPKPTIKWYLDEMEITETKTEFTRIESDDGAKLVIKEVNSQLSGKYTCKLSNECGEAETSAKLTVNCAPRIIKHLQDTTVEEGATLHLEVEVEGCPSPTVKWLRNGREVSADARIKISRDTQRNETYNLAVNLIKYEEQGEYEVVVTNSLGTVSSKSYVTVHKITHTDAIEETGEPPQKFEIIQDENESQNANLAEKQEIEEVPKKEPSKSKVKEIEEPKSAQGSLAEKVDVEKKRIRSPEPIVEEPVSPQIKPKRGRFAILEDLEISEIEEHECQQYEEQKVEQRGSLRRGISATVEEIEETKPDVRRQISAVEDVNADEVHEAVLAEKKEAEIVETKIEGQNYEEKEIEKKALKRGASATVEKAEEANHEVERQTSEVTDQKVESKKGVLADKEEAALIEVEVESKKVTETDSPNKKTKRAKSFVQDEIIENLVEDSKPKTVQEREREQAKTQKSVRHDEEADEEMEELLSRAQKARQLSDESSKRDIELSEAVPVILDTNMKDGSRPESLDITYIVRGTANPPPTASWTLNDTEIKPNKNLRMTVSENGEEFKLEIKKLAMADAGTYKCTLTNPLGAVKQQAVLEVTPEKELRRPKLKKSLEDQTIVKKNQVIFKVVCIGDPVPDGTWYFNDKELSDSDFEKHKIILETEDHEIEDGLNECSYVLTIPRCERCNGGKYTFKGKNKWSECSTSAILTIVLRPEITGPENISVVPGEPAEFSAVIQSNPNPEVTWTKDGEVVKAGGDIEIVEDVANETYRLIFKKTKLSDEGYYKVIAKNNLGEDSSEARFKAIKEAEPSTEKPRFITGLTDEQVEHTGETSIMIRADGLPKPDIKWFLNDKPITEDERHKIETHKETQVTSTFSVSNYSESDVGILKAIAVNVVGEAETTSRITMLQTPPTFGKRLEKSQDVNEFEPLELKAKINGSPKPTVAWFKDGEPIPEDDPRIKTTLLPDGTVKLNIDNVTANDSGAYKLVVKNPNGETACLCAVAVTQKPQRPKFLKCFKDMSIPTGETLRLEAVIQAYPPPEIKWLKDGLPVRMSANLHVEHHPDGTVALVVDCAKPENAGKYELIATNKLGEAVEDAAVDVEKKPTKPQFVIRLEPQTVVEGFPVKLEVKAEGYPAPTITWKRNGAEVISDKKHVKMMDMPDGTSVLLLDAADIIRDAITYRAIASNEAGEAETSAPLKISPSTKDDEPEDRPIFLHALKDVITDEGQPLVLSAPFTGNPIPSVSWTKDGVPLEPSDRILTTCDGKKLGLRIDNALPSDAGQYGVTIVNPLGTDSSEAKATVHKVFMPPSFTQRFTDLQQLPTRDAKFPCKVSGVPQPEVTWSKDGVPIKETDKYHIKRDGDNCCLYVMNCSPADAGVYRATATNKEGQEVCTGALEVVDNIKIAQKVEPAAFLKRIGDTELFKGMTAKFTACMTGHPEPEVEWFHNDQKIFPSSRIKMETDRAGLLRLTIAGVDQDDLGKYTCKISNPHGSDICHANLNIDTGVEPKPKRPITDQYTEYDKYKRSGAPMPLSDPPIISQMTDRHCTLSWKPSIPSGPRAPVTYQLEMCELPSGDWFTVRSGIRSCTCGVRNLEPFRDYKFRVRVENKYGISDPSPYAITHREKLEPEMPKFRPYLPPEIDFRPETSPYFPRDFDIERPPHDNMAQAPRFLRQEHDTQYGVKDQSTNLFWFVYGYPKPKMTYYFNDEIIESGGRFDMSYTRNGQATLFINKMLDRDVGWYEAVARNEHGEARQRVRLEIAELPMFIRRPEIEYAMLRDRAKFEARIVGVPYPEIKWYKDWKPLAASSRTKIQFVEPDIHILIINDVICKDEGLYSVSARNVAGSASSSAMLYVEENDLEYNIRTYSNCSPVKTKRRLYTDLYDIGDELGRGTQGITYHAVERMNGRNYAAKVMHGRGEMRPYMYNELEMMNQLRHRKLISLHDAYEIDESLTLILELASGGELVKDYLLKQDYYTESDIAGFIRQTLQGLQYMHERGFGHMGLDLGDLLISHPGGDDLKITDFGLTRRIQMGRLYPLNFGMPEYVSPECANGEGVGLGHDMWSIGIITYILLSGRSPFRGVNDMETLTRIREGKWTFMDDEWWLHISSEARDFISKLLVFQADGRLDVHAALRHPWLERADKLRMDEYRISSRYLSDYWRLYREWYDNANCRRWFRRRPLEGAFTHPSRMVYPPGEDYSPRPTPAPQIKPPRIPTWEEQLPTRSPLNYEIGMIKSESHYQNGPDTYLLQLRDVDFPVRLREYMKVAGSRGPGASYIVSDENGYDWRTPTIRERRRFTDIMDEEIDDERKARINLYGTSDSSYSIRRLKHELGSRLDTYVEAEAFLESKQEGRLPFFREKPQMSAMIEGQDLKLSCFAVGEPKPIIQWFKNDQIIAESHRIKIISDEEGRSFLKLCPALSFDQGMYKVVARNKIGQTIARARIVLGLVPDEPDSPEVSDASDTEILLTWKQPKFDGNSPVLCYRLEYKLADDMEWTKKADNIDHEFYLMSGLTPNSSYIFRLAARNAIGWSDQGVPSSVIKTKDEGSPKVQVSQAIQHLQQITDSGQEVGADDAINLDYKIESQPVEWESANAQEQYEFISEISRGRFSTVLKAIDKRTDALVVAKILDLSPEHVHDVDGEFAALRSLRHERVAGLLAAYRGSESSVAVFIMEKLQGADVLTYLASRHEYNEQMVATIITQVLDGLQYLHWRGLCHLDLQPDNVVMSAVRSIQIKLVDLGSAHRVTKLGTKVPVVGHPDYISPEVLSEEPAIPQTDIWSVGVLTYVMLSGVVPFRGKDENENRQNILFVRYQFEHLYSEISQEGTRFLMLLFKRQPNKRPTAEECHENRWLMPTDHMIKKRERAVFLGNRLKEYSTEYHNEKAQVSQDITQKMGGKFNRSHSIQEELLTAP